MRVVYQVADSACDREPTLRDSVGAARVNEPAPFAGEAAPAEAAGAAAAAAASLGCQRTVQAGSALDGPGAAVTAADASMARGCAEAATSRDAAAATAASGTRPVASGASAAESGAIAPAEPLEAASAPEARGGVIEVIAIEASGAASGDVPPIDGAPLIEGARPSFHGSKVIRFPLRPAP